MPVELATTDPRAPRDRGARGALAVLVVALAYLAGGAAIGAPLASPAITVSVSPALADRLASTYGESERAVLEARVREALAREFAVSGTPSDAIRIEGTIVDARPGRPTRRQVADNPSIDPVRSVLRGGAELEGRVLASDGKERASVHYRRFAPDIASASASADPWADARLAIDGFARALALKAKAPR